jgi:hypothetical protein
MLKSSIGVDLFFKTVNKKKKKKKKKKEKRKENKETHTS